MVNKTQKQKVEKRTEKTCDACAVAMKQGVCRVCEERFKKLNSLNAVNRVFNQVIDRELRSAWEEYDGECGSKRCFKKKRRFAEHFKKVHVK